jgi:transcriptional regulator with XRE-family HTH domain
MSLSREQVIAARKVLGWSRVKLSTVSGVGNGVIVIFENGLHVPPSGALAALKRALEAAGVEFTNDGEPGARMKNGLIKLQFRNAQLRDKITRALSRADESVQREDDERAKRLATAADDTVETLADVFGNLRGRALALVDAGVAKRKDFPEIN